MSDYLFWIFDLQGVNHETAALAGRRDHRGSRLKSGRLQQQHRRAPYPLQLTPGRCVLDDGPCLDAVLDTCWQQQRQ